MLGEVLNGRHLHQPLGVLDTVVAFRVHAELGQLSQATGRQDARSMPLMEFLATLREVLHGERAAAPLGFGCRIASRRRRRR